MFKSILCIVFFVTISLAQSCSELSCSSEGQKCTTDYYTDGFLLSTRIYTNQDEIVFCDSGYYCNYVNSGENENFGVCSKVGLEGDQCPGETPRFLRGLPCDNNDCSIFTVSTGCAIGLSCYGNGNGPATCQYLGYLTLGQDCESDLQCVDGLRCDTMETETCVVNINQTVVETIICQESSQCKPNEYCDITGDSNVCSPLISDGQSCDSSDQCLPTSVCDLGQCKKIYGSGESADCDQSMVCDISQNLFCNGKCTPLPTSPTGNCNSSAECSDFESCVCTGAQGNGQCTSNYIASPAQCKTSVTTFLQCLADNSCSSPFNIGNSFAPDSCAYKNCGEHYCGLVSNCVSLNFNKCNTDPLLGSICTSDSSIIQLSIMMIVIFSLFSILL